MGDVVKNFLEPLERQFTMPKGVGDDPVAWTNDYVEAMEHYTDSLLALAAKNIIRERQSRSFPLVAECIKACRDTMEAMSGPDLRKPVLDRHDEWSDERRKHADKLIDCPMGREAVREGWAWALWDWLRVNSRYPSPQEADAIRTKGLANNAKFWQIVNKPVPVVNPSFGKDLTPYIRWHKAANERLRKLVSA